MQQIFMPGSTYFFKSDNDPHVQITYTIANDNNQWGNPTVNKHEILVQDMSENGSGLTLFSVEKANDDSPSVGIAIVGYAEKRVLSPAAYEEVINQALDIFSIDLDQLSLPYPKLMISPSQKEQFTHLQNTLKQMNPAVV